MKITSITAWSLPLTSHETYYMADGKTCDAVDSIVLRLGTNTGLGMTQFQVKLGAFGCDARAALRHDRAMRCRARSDWPANEA
jgi:hypothetical protein